MSTLAADENARTWRDWSCRVDLVLDSKDPRQLDLATNRVRTLMNDVASSASRFHAGSDLLRINAAAGHLVPVAPLTVRLVTAAIDAARSTDGAVDPTVGRALEAAGYDADIDVVRRRVAPALATERTGGACLGGRWDAVVVDQDARLVGVPSSVHLDLGATAKAWTADEAARLVAEEIGADVLVGIGGDVAVAGPGRRSWQVSVTEVERGDARPAPTVSLGSGGLATSSVMARRWAGAHHLVDPRTGLPTSGPIRTASVWAASCLQANVLSTAAIVWGENAESELTTRGVTARLVSRTGAVRVTGGWPDDEQGDAA